MMVHMNSLNLHQEQTIADCGDFAAGPNATWTTACVELLLMEHSSQGPQTFIWDSEPEWSVGDFQNYS